LSLSELSLDNGVGSVDERIKTLFDAVKGYNTTVSVSSVRFEKGVFSGAYEIKTSTTPYRFNLGIKPSANVFLNGQFYLLQNALAQSINNDVAKTKHQETWSSFISVSQTNNTLKISFPEFKPYGTELMFQKTGKNWTPLIDAKATFQEPDKALRAFWTTLALPDSFRTSKEILYPATVSVQSETRTVNANRVMQWPEFEKWIKHLMPEVLPVYYGTMSSSSTDSAVRVGSWSFVDPLLKMEHLFKVTQKIRERDGKLELYDVVVQGTFCVRLDNIEDLYGTRSGSGPAEFPPFKLDVRKKQQ
jgi:hypothetical protein